MNVIPATHICEAVNEVVVDLFLLCMCKCLTEEMSGRKFLLIPQMVVYRKETKERNYSSDAGLCELPG